MRVSASLITTTGKIIRSEQNLGVSVQDDTFESVSCIDIDLLCLSNFFEQFLDDYSVVVPYLAAGGREVGGSMCVWYDLPGCNLDVEVTLDDVDVELPLRGCHEDSLVDFELAASRRSVGGSV